jgi:ribonuclease HI
MTAWVIWNNRNNWVFNHTKEPGLHLGVKAMSMWGDWKSVKAVSNNSSTHEQQQHALQWQKPNYGWYRCNVDASFYHEVRKTSLGCCVRDSRGHFGLGGSSVIQGRCSINIGEALAMLEAIKELSQRGFTNVLFETDCRNVADAIRHMHNSESEFSSIIHRIKRMLSFNSDFEIEFIKRQADMVASGHFLT